MAKNHITSEVGATIFAVLFLIAWSFGAGGCSRPRGVSIAEHDGLSVDQISAELAKSKIALAEESARRAELALQANALNLSKGDA